MKRQTIVWLKIVGYIALVIIALGFGCCRGACSPIDENDAKQAAVKQNYKDVQILSRDWFLVGVRGCDSHDALKFEAKATNVHGDRVNLLICSGWILKGMTVRTE